MNVGASNTPTKLIDPRYLPTTTSLSVTGAVISISIVPDAHSCEIDPMQSIGTTKQRNQSIQSNRCRISAGCPGVKSWKNANPHATRSSVIATYAIGDTK